jgi:hypothetical protein
VAQFFQASRFGELGSVGKSVSSFQNVYDNSTNPEVYTLVGAVSFIEGQGNDSNDVFEVLNGASSQTFSVKGDGSVKTLGDLIQFKGSDVASASALTLGLGNIFNVTGVVAITSIVSKGVGAIVKLRFTGILTLTHHATDLILPTGANITTQVGDEVEFVEYAVGDWRCTNYLRADGTALVGGGGGGGHVIQEEGTPLTSRSNLNFIGTGITASDNAGADSTDVTLNEISTKAATTLSAWTLISGNQYYADFAHNLGATDVNVQLWDSVTGETIRAEEVDRTDGNTVRVTIRGNTASIRILVDSGNYGIGGTGEANTFSNTGSGAGIGKGKVGVDIQLKSLIASQGLNLVQNTNDITIEKSTSPTTISSSQTLNVTTHGDIAVDSYKCKMGIPYLENIC